MDTNIRRRHVGEMYGMWDDVKFVTFGSHPCRLETKAIRV
jgi:hypothetical protein